MMRICNSLSEAGYEVLLVGRKRRTSIPLKQKSFEQKRLNCFFDKGKFFYIEYNIRLFLYLLFASTDVYCAIDLDTILPNLFASKIRNKKRVYDAHELFCEMDEITSRPAIYKAWKAIEKYSVPQFENGYTIGECYAEEFEKMYGVTYEIVRNATILQTSNLSNATDKYILYQGAVNEGRCFENLIPAMKDVDGQLIICGEGNYYEQAQALVKLHLLESKIIFKGYVEPHKLKEYTQQAYVGITLFTNQGKSNFLSMANRFFDYMHYGVPQLCVGFPEYKKVNEQFEIAVLINDLSPQHIAASLNAMLQDEALHSRLQQNCLLAREKYCWQEEEKKLVSFYKKLLG
jgi:glycosyltransferase involved in cell wall biosynthesis